MFILFAVFFIAIVIIVVLLIAPHRWFSGASTPKNSDQATLAAKAKAQANERFALTLEREATKLEKTLQQRAQSLDRDFTTKLQALNDQQLKQYEQALAATLQKTLQDLHTAGNTGNAARKAFEESVAADSAKAKAEIIAKLDKGAAEIMLSYLAEVAGELDYQQQKEYLFNALETNKDALKKDIEHGL